MRKYILSLLCLIAITSCSVSSDESNKSAVGKNSGTGGPVNRLNWDAIPSKYNPEVVEENFQTNNVNRIYVDMFSFKDDVEVVYSSNLAPGQGFIKIYTVYKNSGSIGVLGTSVNNLKLQLNRYGTYQCSISTENGNIKNLDGLCFVRVQIYLPKDSEIEVYNLKQIVSKRFIPIESDEFIKAFKDASFSENKKNVIEQYLSSYRETGKTPQLISDQLGIIIDGLSGKNEDQFDALRKLHAFVYDRQNLKFIIEKEFNYFDREEAKRICGL